MAYMVFDKKPDLWLLGQNTLIEQSLILAALKALPPTPDVWEGTKPF